MAQVYAIASGKGGTGKTTTAINLAAAINSFKEDVVVLDANLTTPNIGLHFGAPIVPVTLNHILQGKADVEEAIYEHPSGIKIIPCSLSLKDLQKVNYHAIKNISKELKKLFDHIILDTAAGLGDEARMAIAASDEVILVANPNILSVTDALKTIKLAEEMKKYVRGVILTRVRNDENEMSAKNIVEMLEVPILGIVPEDNAVPEALNRKNAVVYTRPRSKAARAYKDVAAKILGKRKLAEPFYIKILEALNLR